MPTAPPSISIAAAESGSREKASFHGRIPNDLTRLLKRLAPFGPAGRVKIAYEAGPTGYGLARRLRSEGYDCVVIAPAKTPRASSDRVKTDRRDAMKLATFLRSGHLTEVRVPTPEEEALRGLTAAEREVFRLLAEGLDNRAIAGQLGKSEKTVRNQVSSILAKLDLHSRAQAIVFAQRKQGDA